MSNTLTRLSIKKKITAIFANGVTQSNLGVLSVVGFLSNVGKTPVEVAPDQEARALLNDLARSSGRIIERSTEGTYLTLPAPVTPREPLVVPVASGEPVVVNPPVLTRAQQLARMKDKLNPRHHRRGVKVVRKYPTLSSTFFRGSVKGQILSVYKKREALPQKVLDYKAALAAGDCTLGHTPLRIMLVDRLRALGIETPEELKAQF